MLRAVGVSTEKLKFVLGSSYQRSPDYILDMYRLGSLISEHDAKRAGAEIVNRTDNAPLSGLLYSVLQVLYEQYLDVDVQFGGLDQRKLFIAAKEWSPKLGYKQRAHIMNPMVPGLHGGKMSSSEPAKEVVSKKIDNAIAIPQAVEVNEGLAFAEHVLLPASSSRGTSKIPHRPGTRWFWSLWFIPRLTRCTMITRNDVLTLPASQTSRR
ncbi:Nucleotidylyl transferase [Aspergillus novofumigatus IBT 16806]|uniref:tyrosine--tRNA ligase n=1 Tax=Aspergillus novofumigatus (strain IBT 16806) TaxID=1392255 RepID=A0A2I1BT99_ASPN1|nr:Nucleotidylyl transferase [Aspergillus novofumigatus IBT 16806]PKX88599.1 Nucleotidylyl transferase [Aspergillus novofumigatus IBT 16806]